jgi:putative ABC transport system permease protein
MNTIELDGIDYLLLFLLVLLPLGLIYWLRLKVLKTAVIGLLRMLVQLTLVGLYLKIIFDLNSLLLNVAWIMAMILVANTALLGRAGLKKKVFFHWTFLGTAGGSILVVAWFVLLVIQPEPLYDARYLIPVFGMVLGNCMRGNVLSLERFYNGIREKENEFITYQMLGATTGEASRPFMQKALMTALGPQLSTIATMGIVSLPGMMTGQILGGSFPVTAIKYQIAIVVCILAAQLFSSTLNIFLTRNIALNEMGMLRKDIFA